MAELPPCGLYRTTVALDDEVPAGRLVYFHSHGDPGPGVYLPKGWTANRAAWQEQGHTIPSAKWAATLHPLPAEGFYRVREPFACCPEQCRTYEADLLVQLGYDGDAEPLLFVPEWTPGGLALPETGIHIDAARLGCLSALHVDEGDDEDADTTLH
jgi:hypothetical protein